jgi:hypothetical protein
MIECDFTLRNVVWRRSRGQCANRLKHGGGDDGYASPACALWLAHDRIYDRIFVIAELYRAGMTPEIFARQVLAIDRHIPINLGDGEVIDNDDPLSGVIDSASFADVGMGGGRADRMNSLGCKWKPAEKGVGSRLAGISAILARLALKSDSLPGLIVFNACQNLIRTLPALCYSESHPEDVNSDSDDHCFDALRYGLTRKVVWARVVRVKGL